MLRYETFADVRLGGGGFNCGSVASTRDHAPPKVFLDEPYPDNIIKVASCAACNESASLDEQYVACLIEATLRGSTDPDDLQRSKIARTLRRDPALRSKLARAKFDVDGYIAFQPESDRVSRVLTKMARGLWYFEHAEAPTDMETICRWWTAPLSPAAEAEFFRTSSLQGWPEIGSRAFVRACRGLVDSTHSSGWLELQEGRFSYSTDDGRVRMILSDYLYVDALMDA
ncbi:hypothetical protein [Candidatus Poriferisodalis sp.]|uniref:hypothetical protein n=1 Tax=Candidatus Poriferisodalis sp. TaxID=3101277 RepID=UPI003D1416B9